MLHINPTEIATEIADLILREKFGSAYEKNCVCLDNTSVSYTEFGQEEFNIYFDTLVGLIESKQIPSNPNKISIHWSIDDLKSCAYNLYSDGWIAIYDEKKLTEALHLMDYNHDANVGINWDTIQYYLDGFCKHDKGVELYANLLFPYNHSSKLNTPVSVPRFLWENIELGLDYSLSEFQLDDSFFANPPFDFINDSSVVRVESLFIKPLTD